MTSKNNNKPNLPSPLMHLALAGMAGAVVLISGPSYGGGFEDALSKAYSANPTLQQARAGLRATDEGVPAALSGFRPNVSATGTVSDYSKETNTSTAKTELRPKTMSLNVTQPIFSGLGTVSSLRQAVNTVKATRARLLGTEQNVLLATATAYLNVVRDGAVLKLNANNEQVLGRQLDATQDRFKVGEITRTDVHLAEARLARARAERIGAEGQLEASKAAYVNIVGEAGGDFSAPDLKLNLPQSLDEALSWGRVANPRVVAAQYDELAAKESTNSARASLMPSVNLNASAKRSIDSVQNNYESDELTGTITLSIPLYQGGSAYSSLRRSKHQAAASRLALDQALRDTTEEIHRSWENNLTAWARIGAFETQVKASETALEGVEKEASVGSRTVLDVLDAEQELLDARVNLVRSQRDATVAALTLLSSVGRLSAKELKLPVDLYDAEGHYQDVKWKMFGGTID